VKKSAILIVAFITLILFSTIVVSRFVHTAKSNPLWSDHQEVNMGSVVPDQNTKPPTILTLSPENNTVYRVNTLSLSLNVSIGDSTTASSCFLDLVYCKADWQSNITFVYKHGDNYVYPFSREKVTEFSGAVNFTEIPDGNHTIKVYAFENGKYPLYVRKSFSDLKVVEHCYNSFQIIGSSLIRFAVDTTAPKISILALENRNYSTSTVPLNFTTDERIFQSSYSLDGQDNVTIAGNTTLTDLIEGEHKVTVFVTDEVGNTGASETVIFTVEEPPEPFPTTMVIAPVASVAFVSAGLLFYFKKRQGGKYP
jgi:hypothetical protein